MLRSAILFRKWQALRTRCPRLRPVVLHVIQEVLNGRAPQRMRCVAEGACVHLIVATKTVAEVSSASRQIKEAVAVGFHVSNPSYNGRVSLRRLEIRDEMRVVRPAIGW